MPRPTLALATLATLGFAAVAPLAGAGEARVRVADGLVSATFDAAPVGEAVAAIRRAVGLEIVLPASVQGKTVTLAVEHLPLERFIRQVLERLEVGGYALIYEASGETRRLIVVESARPAPPDAGSAAGPAATPSRAPAAPPVLAARPAPPLGAPPTHAMPLVRVGPNGITITPRGQYERLDLTVLGRNGRTVRRQYPSGTPAYFDIVDEQGKPLLDGSYGYELIVVPAIPDQIRERMEAVRESPDDRVKLEMQLREEGWLPKEPLIHSGHFSVSGGQIVVAGESEGSRRRP